MEHYVHKLVQEFGWACLSEEIFRSKPEDQQTGQSAQDSVDPDRIGDWSLIRFSEVQ